MLRFLTQGMPGTAEFPGFSGSFAAQDSRFLCVCKNQREKALRCELVKRRNIKTGASGWYGRERGAGGLVPAGRSSATTWPDQAGGDVDLEIGNLPCRQLGESDPAQCGVVGTERRGRDEELGA